VSALAANLRLSLSRPGLRLGLFALTAVAALYFGFVHFPVTAAQAILRQAGYYVILLTFVLWVLAGWRCYRASATAAAVPPPKGRWAAVGLTALLAVLAVSHEPYRSKILYDEYVLQSTAYNLHFFRENAAMVRGYEIQGVFLPTDSYVDKRPVFFPFLLSLVHDLAGYRLTNVFFLNTGLFVVALGLIGWLGWKLNGWRGGLLAIGLLGSLPLFAQNATGAGMELLNLCMLLTVIIQGSLWLARPDEVTLAGFVLAVLLLVQSRYESALYVVPAGLAIGLGWWRARRLMITWTVIAAPLLLIPVALQQKVISNSPMMWELHENQTSRFSVDYLAGNLQGAYAFFTGTGLTQANSLLLGPLGLMALVVLGWRLWSRRAQLCELRPLQINLLLFGSGILGVTVLVMFYYWSALNDPMAARFALPFHLLLVLAVVAAAAWGDRKCPVSAVALGLVGAFILGSSAPRQSLHFYSHLGNDEIAWEERVVAARRAGTRLMLTNKSTLPWLINDTPAILLDRARTVADRLVEQLHLPDFSEILVTQCARPGSAEGDYQVPPEEALPAWFHLELVAERRFGTKLARISRLVAIDLPRDYKPSSPPPVTSEAGDPGKPSR
jgi:hypothetical protein